MKSNIPVRKILTAFPKTKIHSISDLTEANSNDEIIQIKIKKEK